MAKKARAGEMRTRITVQKLTAGIDTDGFRTETWANVLSGTSMIRCKWAGAHGTDVLENKRAELGQTATITLRYTSLIDQRCRVFHEADAQTDANAWTVISVNVPYDKREFLEITLQRAVTA